MTVVIVNRAMNDGPYCGDQGASWVYGDKVALCLADGVGHGQPAEVAAYKALAYVSKHLEESLPEIFRGCNEALFGGRGAALAVAIVDTARRSLFCVTVGNVDVVVSSETSKRLPAVSGIIGAKRILVVRRRDAGARKGLATRTLQLKPTQIRLHERSIILMHTDGVRGGVDPFSYDASLRADLPELAVRIMGDWRNKMDDAGLILFRDDRDHG